ncbi:MAG: hypothetical protein HFJ66_08280 [Eggerthellaceae bacterium]|nr:hypothetical protein [Eggerthellaceae bacterium]
MTLKTKACAMACVALIATFSLMAVGCASAPEAKPANDAAPAQGRAMSAEQAVPEESVGEKSQAMVIIAGDTPLFVDTATQTPYVPTIPTDGLTDADGNAISVSQLAVGNIVEVTGNGIMLESYPGQYPGITAVKVLQQGNPADAERYEDIVEQVTGFEMDDDAVPYASLAYSTDLANTSIVLGPEAYTWEFPNGGVDSEELDMLEDNGDVDDDIIDARLSAETAGTVLFDKAPQGIAVTRMTLKAAGTGYAVDPSVPEEQISSNLNGTEADFAIAPEALYVINASYEEGSVIYAFVALQPRG